MILSEENLIQCGDQQLLDLMRVMRVMNLQVQQTIDLFSQLEPEIMQVINFLATKENRPEYTIEAIIECHEEQALQYFQDIRLISKIIRKRGE